MVVRVFQRIDPFSKNCQACVHKVACGIPLFSFRYLQHLFTDTVCVAIIFLSMFAESTDTVCVSTVSFLCQSS